MGLLARLDQLYEGIFDWMFQRDLVDYRRLRRALEHEMDRTREPLFGDRDLYVANRYIIGISEKAMAHRNRPRRKAQPMVPWRVPGNRPGRRGSS